MTVNPVNLSVSEPICNRFSPYLFEDREVESEKLLQCFEAARWAPSSYNDQPWFWIVARKQDTAAFDKMLSVLAEANRGWAKAAGVLVISVIRNSFAHNDTPNRVALHDLGAAAALMSLEATRVGLQIHQMAGVDQEAAAIAYGVPEGHTVETATAIGYPHTGLPDSEGAAELRKREQKSRQRIELEQQVFADHWNSSAEFVKH